MQISVKNRTIPYGYQGANGNIIIHPNESVIVTMICQAYISGTSLLNIANRLTEQQIEYMPGTASWNKSRIKRIIEDERYLGTDKYPEIISIDIFQAMQQIKNERNTQKDTDRQSEIFQIGIPVLCPECKKPLIRRQDKRCKCKGRWSCEQQDGCKTLIAKDDSELLADITAIINQLISNPWSVRANEERRTETSIELQRLNNEIGFMLDSNDIDKTALRKKLFECMAQKYKKIDSTRYSTQRLIDELIATEPLDTFSPDLLKKIAKAIMLQKDGTVALILTNDQIIRKESDDGSHNPTT